jgi:uncharacterized membrane protein (DUF106 family)
MYQSITSIDLSFLSSPPNATYAIMLLSLALGLITSYIGTRSMDIEEYRRLMVESNRARKEMMSATKSGNQRRISKAQNKQQQIMSQQSKMSMDRMKSTMFFTLPLILIWPVLRNFFGGTIIAYFPFDFPLGWIPREMGFGHWYILTSISFNIIISRVIGLTFEIDPEEAET